MKKNKVLKWFFGVQDTVDEYVKKEIGRISTKTVFILFIFELFYVGLTYFFANSGLITDFESYFYLTLFIQFIGIVVIFLGFLMLNFNRKNSIPFEVTNQKERENIISLLKKKYVRSAPISFLIFLSISTVFDFSKNNLFKQMFTLQKMTGAVIWTILFSLIMYSFEKGEIRIAKEMK
ncbi:DUF3278 domain-containing protein [Companilactobacillus musae]|uniref:DUF3278 domain-containing protein n=1 Tax=Companilactobacillus musae TaxID=1903258 RepID=UPI0013C2F385|nr:DUF3278 domain-containing protein [Companilactobacillus musae]